MQLELEQKVIEWAKERGIFEKSDPKSQLLKTVSEIGELADAVNKGDLDGIVDGIGDIQVTLILLCAMYSIKMDYCLDSAYNQISERTGEMVNGVFVKD